MGLNFFMYDQRMEHSRSIYNIIDILSEVGGLSTSLLAIIGLLVTWYNNYFYSVYFLSLLYFVKDKDDSGGDDEDFEFLDNAL